jgi:serine/threonine protein phosphatase PrpC
VDVAPEATWVVGERYVLGTDGWHGAGRGLPWDAVVRVMREATTPEAACEEMVATAVDVDGSDNATVLVVWCEE